MTELRGPLGPPEAAGYDADPITVPPSERVPTLDVTAPPRVSAPALSGAQAASQAPSAAAASSTVGPAKAAKRVAPLAVWVKRAARALILTMTAVSLSLLLLIVAFRYVEPPTSAFMLRFSLMGEPIDRIPVRLEQISPHLIQAVIVSEDGRFCRHRGVDWGALAEAIEDTRAGIVRGGSTIAMQTAKNLFLWPSRSYVRKALEIPLALALDVVWGKPRVLEVYFNIVEWGPGIFGAEAAAQYHFSKSAAELTLDEAALLAAALPNPIARDAGEPQAQVRRLAQRLKARMGKAEALARCVLQPNAR